MCSSAVSSQLYADSKSTGLPKEVVARLQRLLIKSDSSLIIGKEIFEGIFVKPICKTFCAALYKSVKIRKSLVRLRFASPLLCA